MTYSYDPAKIRGRGKDQMRFELGDTYVDGGVDTCALSDEEYVSIIGEPQPGRRLWLAVKLQALEAIVFKLSYMVNTRIDVLSYGLGDRAELWRKLRDDVYEELLAATGAPTMAESAKDKPPYFYTGMHDSPCTLLNSSFPFRRP